MFALPNVCHQVHNETHCLVPRLTTLRIAAGHLDSLENIASFTRDGFQQFIQSLRHLIVELRAPWELDGTDLDDSIETRYYDGVDTDGLVRGFSKLVHSGNVEHVVFVNTNLVKTASPWCSDETATDIVDSVRSALQGSKKVAIEFKPGQNILRWREQRSIETRASYVP